MDDQRDRKNGESTVRSSIKKLREKFVPSFKYGLLISGAVNFVMLVIGILKVHQCPVSKNIPLFLIATGAIGLVAKFVSYVRDRLSKHVQVVYFESALYCAECVFFFLGTYWVYKEFQPSYDPQDTTRYCNKTAYLVAFCYLTVFYGFLITLLLGFACFLCCICFLAAVSSKDIEAQPNVNTEEVTATLTSEHDVDPKP